MQGAVIHPGFEGQHDRRNDIELHACGNSDRTHTEIDVNILPVHPEKYCE
jgi:hypothetical protein